MPKPYKFTRLSFSRLFGGTTGFMMVFSVFCMSLMILGAGLPAHALEPGDSCPDFELPWLSAEGTLGIRGLLSTSEITVLFFWNRGCPHCTEVALGLDEFVDAVQPYETDVVGVIFGPGDPVSLELLLEQEEVFHPQLWDAHATVAAAYGLGMEHLGVFVIDSGGTIQSIFDNTIPNLIDAVLPAVKDLSEKLQESPVSQESPALVSKTSPMLSVDLPSFRTDGRFRFLSTEGARLGDQGLYGEELESGSLFIFRWDLNLHWELARGIEFVPLVRVSNESDEVLTDGPEKFSSRYGSASLHFRHKRFASTLGAFKARISPFILQRWDEEDAPPLGGVSGCATCGGGASGLSQRSLEILDSDYTFEGLTASYSHRYVKAKGWLAVPLWEKKVLSAVSQEEELEARYRRVLYGGSIDIGRIGSEEPIFNLPTPFGIRLAYLNVGDDRRTVLLERNQRSNEWDEHSYSILGGIGPYYGLRGEVEHIWWHLGTIDRRVTIDGEPTTAGQELDRTALRAGLRGRWMIEKYAFWVKAHRLYLEKGFDPVYGALSYDGNREGWRFSGGVQMFYKAGGSRERLTVSGFYRGTQETEEEDAPGSGLMEDYITSISITGRPVMDLLAGIHFVHTKTNHPDQFIPDEKSNGYSFDLRWEGIPTVDPILRIDAIRRDNGNQENRTVWQGYLSVRVVK